MQPNISRLDCVQRVVYVLLQVLIYLSRHFYLTLAFCPGAANPAKQCKINCFHFDLLCASCVRIKIIIIIISFFPKACKMRTSLHYETAARGADREMR